jgi:hypothetical protein
MFAESAKINMQQKIYTGYAGSQALLFYYKAVGLHPVIISGARIHGYSHCKDSKYIKNLAPMIKWWWPWYKSLTPYNIRVAQKWYTKYYTTQILNKLDPQIVYDELVKFGNGLPVVICCEGEQQESLFCHRHLIAKWLESNISGLVISEFPHINQYFLLSECSQTNYR